MNITGAIQAAFDSLKGKPEGDTSKTEQKVPENKIEEPKSKDSSSNDESDDDDDEDSEKSDDKKTDEKVKTEPDEKTKKALELYELISNPETAEDTINLLLKQAERKGYNLKDKEDKKEVQEDILAVLKKTLPEDDQYLVDALGPALKYIIEQNAKNADVKISTLEKKLKTYEAQTEAQRFANDVERVLSKTEYKDHLPAMEKLMIKFQPADNVPLEEYVEDIYKLAKGNKKSESDSVRQAKKAQSNLEEEVPSSKSSARDEELVLNRPPTLSESIQAAREGKKIKISVGA